MSFFSSRAVFLDRDGVINNTLFKMGKMRAPYSLDEFSFIGGVPEAVKLLKQKGFVLIVVTNQPDVARGWVSRDQVDVVNGFIMQELELDDLFACFHTEKDDCQCRKPRPGMILSAERKWNVDLAKSFMVGDRMSDVEAGLSAGCKTILVGEGEVDIGVRAPHHHCRDLLEAATGIINQEVSLVSS
jgi:D-glycero-D-manno-heptose 1,7-bisphosphate phosphatase